MIVYPSEQEKGQIMSDKSKAVTITLINPSNKVIKYVKESGIHSTIMELISSIVTDDTENAIHHMYYDIAKLVSRYASEENSMYKKAIEDIADTMSACDAAEMNLVMGMEVTNDREKIGELKRKVAAANVAHYNAISRAVSIGEDYELNNENNK